MLAPELSAIPSAIADQGGARNGARVWEEHMLGLAFLTSGLIIFVSVIAAIGVSSFFTLSRE
jgi:hypothetical protein